MNTQKHKLTYNHTICASFIGYMVQATVNNFAPLLFLIFHDTFGISLSKITLLVTLNFCTQLITDLLSARFIDKIGYRISIVAAHMFAAAGLLGIALLPNICTDPYIGLIISVILYAIGGGLTEVLLSPIVEACPTDHKASIMSLLHSFYCWGSVLVILVSTIFFAILGSHNWPILACIWSLLPIANGIFFMLVPMRSLTEDHEGLTIKQLFSLKTFWIFVLLMVAAGASEQAMSQWASTFAESGLGITKTIGDILGPCFFAILMGLSRIFYAKFGERIDLLSFIIGSAVLCSIGYGIATVSFIGCGICGLAVGIMWPGVFSLAAERCPTGGTAMFALLALAGDLGCSSGPTVVGMVSTLFNDNLTAGLFSAIIFPIMIILGGIMCKKHTC